MNPKEVLQILQELRALPYFPNDEYVMNALVKLCGSMCHSLEQVQWLVNRMTSGIYTAWPGPAEMRACLCCRYKPKDGITAYSSVYPDGLPKDPTAPPRIEGPQLKALPAGASQTADASLDRKIRLLARAKDLEARPLKRTPPPTPNFKPVTAADIERAVEELRDKRARELMTGGDAA